MPMYGIIDSGPGVGIIVGGYCGSIGGIGNGICGGYTGADNWNDGGNNGYPVGEGNEGGGGGEDNEGGGGGRGNGIGGKVICGCDGGCVPGCDPGWMNMGGSGFWGALNGGGPHGKAGLIHPWLPLWNLLWWQRCLQWWRLWCPWHFLDFCK